jgi:hypothetical protein
VTSNHIWIFGDYSQAEARVVAWAGPVPTMKSWFERGEDIHLNTAKVIARTIQENHVSMPNSLFMGKHWSEYTKEDKKERYIGKQTNHANNYGLGKTHFGLITGLPVKYAELVQNIYFSTFPEVKTSYQAWIDYQLRETRTIWLPEPFHWRRIFYDAYGPELSRAAYAFYAAGTVGALLVKTLNEICEVFANTLGPRDHLWTPEYIRSGGLDVRLQIHDAVGVSVVNDPEVVAWSVKTIRNLGEIPIYVKDSTLVIPMDFKTGPNWGELKDYVDSSQANSDPMSEGRRISV